MPHFKQRACRPLSEVPFPVDWNNDKNQVYCVAKNLECLLLQILLWALRVNRLCGFTLVIWIFAPKVPFLIVWPISVLWLIFWHSIIFGLCIGNHLSAVTGQGRINYCLPVIMIRMLHCLNLFVSHVRLDFTLFVNNGVLRQEFFSKLSGSGHLHERSVLVFFFLSPTLACRQSIHHSVLQSLSVRDLVQSKSLVLYGQFQLYKYILLEMCVT